MAGWLRSAAGCSRRRKAGLADLQEVGPVVQLVVQAVGRSRACRPSAARPPAAGTCVRARCCCAPPCLRWAGGNRRAPAPARLRSRPRRRGSCRPVAGRLWRTGAGWRRHGAWPLCSRVSPGSAVMASPSRVNAIGAAESAMLAIGQLLGKVLHHAAQRVRRCLTETADRGVGHHRAEIIEQGPDPRSSPASASPPCRCPPGTGCTDRRTRARRSASHSVPPGGRCRAGTRR